MLKLDDKIETVLGQYHERIAFESTLSESLTMEERMGRIDEFLLPVGVETGIFLNILAKSAQSKTILEIGTSYGYSTVWLAEAARANEGRVITLEISSEKAEYARNKIEQAGLSGFVDFRIGNALEFIADAPETFDFVLLDLWKELYVSCFDLFLSKLKKGAWVAADNMIYPPQSHEETEAYRKRVRKQMISIQSFSP